MPDDKEVKAFVIDASIARAAGNRGEETSISGQCTAFLNAIDKAKHMLVMTPDIRAEWDEHQSIYAQTWRRKMTSRKQVAYYRAEQVENSSLRDEIDHLASTDKARAVMLKDVHLLEAALVSDKLVASLDEIVRELFSKLVKDIAIIGQISWLNPTKPDEQVLKWLEAGCPESSEQKLGFKNQDE